MSLLAIDDLFAVLDRASVNDTLIGVATALGLKVTAWQPGQPVRTIFASIAQIGADYTRTSSEAIKGGFRETSTGGWLTLLSRSHFNVERREAEPATGTVDLTNDETSDTDTFQPGDLVFAHASTGKTYKNVGVVLVPASSTLEDVPIEAFEPGTASDAAPGAITEMVTSVIGLSVTNPEAVLGADEEGDDELRARDLEQLGSLSSAGPKEIYSAVVKNRKLNLTSAPITRTKVVADPLTGLLTVYMATASGAPTVGDVTISQATIDKWAEPWCIGATAAAATPLVQAITVEVWVENTSLTPTEIQTAIAARLAPYFKRLPIGGYVIPPGTGRIDHDAIKGEIFQAVAGVVDVDLAVPVGDVAVADNEVPTLGAVVVTVNVL